MLNLLTFWPAPSQFQVLNTGQTLRTDVKHGQKNANRLPPIVPRP